MSENEKALSQAMLKHMFGQIPIVGWGINEYLFDRRSRIKQERVNRFCEVLQNAMSNILEEEIDFDYMKSDEFGDIFESVINKVLQTSSEEKIKRFRDILVGTLTGTRDIEFAETYLDIVSKISETQVEILETYARKGNELNNNSSQTNEVNDKLNEVKTKLNSIRSSKKTLGIDNSSWSEDELQRQSEQLQEKLKLLENKKEEISLFRRSSYFKLEEGEYEFYLQDLVSKGLLKNHFLNTMGSISSPTRSVSEFGSRFLVFILESEP